MASDVGGVHVPKETVIRIPIWVLHHDPNYWEEPEEFGQNGMSEGIAEPMAGGVMTGAYSRGVACYLIGMLIIIVLFMSSCPSYVFTAVISLSTLYCTGFPLQKSFHQFTCHLDREDDC